MFSVARLRVAVWRLARSSRINPTQVIRSSSGVPSHNRLVEALTLQTGWVETGTGRRVFAQWAPAVHNDLEGTQGRTSPRLCMAPLGFGMDCTYQTAS